MAGTRFLRIIHARPGNPNTLKNLLRPGNLSSVDGTINLEAVFTGVSRRNNQRIPVRMHLHRCWPSNFLKQPVIAPILYGDSGFITGPRSTCRIPPIISISTIEVLQEESTGRNIPITAVRCYSLQQYFTG